MFCAPRRVFGGTEGVESRFHVLRACIRFRPYRGRQVPFSCFARPNMFSAIPRVTVPFLYFALPNIFYAVPSASGPVLMFCAPDLIFGSLEGDRFRFLILRAWNSFCRY
jgi:hypothetical protein